MNPEASIEELLSEVNLIEIGLYVELKEYLKKEMMKIKKYMTDINLDIVLLTVFSHYGVEVIESDYFIEIFIKIIKDMNLLKMEITKDDFKRFLKKRILNIKDIEFFENNEAEAYRCEAFFVGNYIKIKKGSFEQTIFNSKLGLIDVNVDKLSISWLFTVYINDIAFIANSL